MSTFADGPSARRPGSVGFTWRSNGVIKINEVGMAKVYNRYVCHDWGAGAGECVSAPSEPY